MRWLTMRRAGMMKIQFFCRAASLYFSPLAELQVQAGRSGSLQFYV